MATKVLMPQLGESVTEGQIIKWFVQEGDRIKQYDPLCEVSTDKVNAEVPSLHTGIVTKIVVPEGESVEVGGLICYIEEEKKEENLSTEVPPSGESLHSRSALSEHGRENLNKRVDMSRRYSPVVLRLAREHQIDLNQIQGTGRGGRITRKDVMQWIEGKRKKESVPVPTRKKEVHSSDDQLIALTSVRRTIADKMKQSKEEIPHAWVMIEVDVTELVNFRERVKRHFEEKEGVKLTYLPFFIKAVVEALKEYPLINSQWAGDHIIQKKEINISLAVAAEDGLYVPVIKRADQKSILGLAHEIQDLARRTRAGLLTQEDVQGGTFTVNNTGSFGSILSQPIINYPQAAILSIESIVKRPVIREGMIAIRDMVNLCLSLDHRILDGLICGRFLQSIKGKLEAMGEGTPLY